MTPETAKQKIQALLDLGIFKGVKVEYENGSARFFQKRIDNIIIHYAYGSDSMSYADNDYRCNTNELWSYSRIKSIEPIPMEPKLLEVGTRVKIIGGDLEGKVGIVDGHREFTDYVIHLGTEWRVFISIYHVIPESLLVEEEPKPKLYRVLKELPGAKVGQIIDGFEMTITHGNGSGLYGIEECEDFFEPIDPKEFEQAGYQVTKK